MIINGVKKRKSGTISINYTEGGKLYGLTLTPQEIVENFKAAQQLRALDSATPCPDCGSKKLGIHSIRCSRYRPPSQ